MYMRAHTYIILPVLTALAPNGLRSLRPQRAAWQPWGSAAPPLHCARIVVAAPVGGFPRLLEARQGLKTAPFGAFLVDECQFWCHYVDFS